jgi:hypothetical protein
VTQNPTHIVYELKLREDGTAIVNLSNAHKAWLKYLAVNSGEIVINWEHAEAQRVTPVAMRRETIKEHMAHLNRMGLTTEMPLVTSQRCLVRLTDMGRNIVTQIMGEIP